MTELHKPCRICGGTDFYLNDWQLESGEVEAVECKSCLLSAPVETWDRPTLSKIEVTDDLTAALDNLENVIVLMADELRDFRDGVTFRDGVRSDPQAIEMLLNDFEKVYSDYESAMAHESELLEARALEMIEKVNR